MSGNLFDLIRGRIPSAGKSLIETAAGERISYGEMLARSGRLAHALVRRQREGASAIAQARNAAVDTLERAVAVRSPTWPRNRLRTLPMFRARNPSLR